MRVITVTWRDLPAEHSPYCEQSNVSTVEVPLITQLTCLSHRKGLFPTLWYWAGWPECPEKLSPSATLTRNTDNRTKCSIYSQTSAVLCNC